MGICSSDFSKYKLGNTPCFNLENKILIGRVVNIYDGDTCTLIVKVFDNYYKFNCRLSDIDTCEIKSFNPINKKLGLDAKYKLIELITNNKLNTYTNKEVGIFLDKKVYLVKIKCNKFDKYGRLLVHIYKYNTKKLDVINSFNHILIKQNLAYPYLGKTKLTEKQQQKVLKLI